MPEIKGRLLEDLHPNGTVRRVFIAHTGGGNEAPLTAKNLDTGEIDFVSLCGLTPERAFALRAELDRIKIVSMQTSIDRAVAAKFRYAALFAGHGSATIEMFQDLWRRQVPAEVGKAHRATEQGQLFK